jgi:hypothetical protein
VSGDNANTDFKPAPFAQPRRWLPTSPTPQYTDFSKDVLGRMLNGLDEAMRARPRGLTRPLTSLLFGGASAGPGATPFTATSFGITHLVLKPARWFAEHAQNLPNIGVAAPDP